VDPREVDVNVASIFDEPRFTRRPVEVGADIGPQPSIPELIERESGPVTDPSDEPMIRVEHHGIRVLSNYFHAGWRNARAGTWLRASVCERLGAVTEALPHPFGLAVFDGWRSLALQQELYDTAYADPTVPEGFLAPPNTDPTRPPPHLTGGSLDLTLTWHGTPLALGTGFDDVTSLAEAAALEHIPSGDRELRRLLFHAMAAQDFVIYRGEWWHFEYGTRRWAGITNHQPMYGPAVPPT
jgi:zinc D-Ala-D-Ala dipeptidase